MRIASINESGQGARNDMIYNSLKKAAGQHGFGVNNYSMYTAEDKVQLIYTQVGTLAVALLNVKAADYVIMGCGTGEGVMLACSLFPGAIYGYVGNALDAYIFVQINDGDTIAIPFAKGFGWGGDLNLEYIFEKLSYESPGQGYPGKRVAPEQRSKRILDGVGKASFREDLVGILKGLDQKPVKNAFSGERLGELFFGKCKDEKLAVYIREPIE